MHNSYINHLKYDLNDDLIIYIDQYVSCTNVTVWNWLDDIDVYKSKYLIEIQSKPNHFFLFILHLTILLNKASILQ